MNIATVYKEEQDEVGIESQPNVNIATVNKEEQGRIDIENQPERMRS